jgi:hypothetical protein
VDAIHRLFEERKLLEDIRLAANGGSENYETDRRLEEQGSPFQPYHGKQIVM